MTLTSSGAASAVLAFLLSSPSSSSSLLRFCAGSAMPLPATEVRDVLGPGQSQRLGTGNLTKLVG